MLEKFEKEGWLQPLFRLVLTKKLQKSGLMLDIDGLKDFHRKGMMEFPKRGDYELWNNFKHDYKKGEKHDRKLMYYHSFQIMQVLNILKLKKFNFIYYDSDKDKDIKKKISHIKKNRDWNKEIFQKRTDELTNRIGVLMLLEERYRSHAFGSITIPIMRRRDTYLDSWIKWTTKTFSSTKFIQQHGLSIRDVEELYKRIASYAYFIDPLERWYDLTRIMKPSILIKLKDKPLTAQFYYDISRMVSFLYYDLTKKHLLEPDIFFDGRKVEWKKNIYSDPFDYATRKTQRGIIRFFVRDPTIRIFFLVEGETEEKVIEKIFEKLQVSMKDDGISVINCRGIENIEEQKLEIIIQTANRDNVSMYVLADNEGTSIQKIAQIKKRINTNFASHIWKKSFEEDHFGKRNVIDWVNSYLKKYGENLTDKEVAEKYKKGKALVTSIESAYGKKYQKDIYRVIRKKKWDLALELLTPRIKKISPSKKVGKPSKIEKVIEKVFNMIPY